MEVYSTLHRGDKDVPVNPCSQRLQGGDLEVTKDAMHMFWHFLHNMNGGSPCANVSPIDYATRVAPWRRSLRLRANNAKQENPKALPSSTMAETPIPKSQLGRRKEIHCLSSIIHSFIIGHIALLRSGSFRVCTHNVALIEV